MLLQERNRGVFQHTAEAGGVQIKILPVLCDRVADVVSALVDRPAELLEQAAVLSFECGEVSVARCSRVIALALDAQIDYSICHTTLPLGACLGVAHQIMCSPASAILQPNCFQYIWLKFLLNFRLLEHSEIHIL